MAKTVKVSRAQKAAASAMVARSAKTGRYVSKSVRKVADAKTAPSRQAAPASKSNQPAP